MQSKRQKQHDTVRKLVIRTRFNPLRMLVERIIATGQSRYRNIYLYFVGFAEGLCLPIPTDIVQFLMSLREKKSVWQLAVSSVAGALTGSIVIYCLAYLFFPIPLETVLSINNENARFLWLIEYWPEQRFLDLIRIIAALFPLHIIALSAGSVAFMNQMPIANPMPATLLISIAVARGGRSVLIALYCRFFGSVTEYYLSIYFNVLLIIAAATGGLYYLFI